MTNIDKSYTAATLVMQGNERLSVIMASPDRIRTQRKFGVSQSQAVSKGRGEEWTAYALYLAWKRETGRDEDFEVFLDLFIGFEVEAEDKDDQELPGEAATPA
jgi:hypothetical protein